MSILKIDGLSVNFGQKSILFDLSLEVLKPQIVGIIGPNGAGKSTLLKTLVGLVKPLSGSACFFGKSYGEMRERIAYVPQRSEVDWSFPTTVLDVVLMGRYARLGFLKWARPADKRAAMDILRRLEMEHLKDRHISELSGGQQQRVFLARALLQEADLYLFDEPFAGVDIATEKCIMEILKGLKEAGKTVLVVHHDLNTVESYFDSVALINTSLVAYGSVEGAFTKEHLARAYGARAYLFEEATSLSVEKSSGMAP